MRKWSVECMKLDERRNEIRVTLVVYSSSGGGAYQKAVDAGYLSIDGEYLVEELSF
jgi:hypothetical protein